MFNKTKLLQSTSLKKRDFVPAHRQATKKNSASKAIIACEAHVSTIYIVAHNYIPTQGKALIFIFGRFIFLDVPIIKTGNCYFSSRALRPQKV